MEAWTPRELVEVAMPFRMPDEQAYGTEAYVSLESLVKVFSRPGIVEDYTVPGFDIDDNRVNLF